MFKRMSAIIVFLLVAAVSFAGEQYLCDLLKIKSYRAAWNAMLAAQKGLDNWVVSYSSDCDGPSTPVEAVSIEGRKHQLAWFCKTHDCGGNQIYVIFAPDGSRAWALLITEKQRWLGNPSPAIRKALKSASEEH